MSGAVPGRCVEFRGSRTDIDPVELETDTYPPFAVRLAIVLMVMLAVMQWLVSFAGVSIWQQGLAIALLLGSGGVALAPIAPRYRFGALIAMALLAFVNVMIHALTAVPPFALRLLLVATLLGYASLALVGACALVSRRLAAGLLVTAVVITIGATAFEAVIEYASVGMATSPTVVRWEGGTAPHPVLEESYPPNTTARTIYVSNPRGYFKKSDPRSQQWRLGSNHQGSAARLVFPESPDFDGVRVEIERAEVPTPWHIQLGSDGLGVRRGDRYTLRFKVRADRPRPFSYGVSQAHPPWQNLGWYQDTTIGSEWADRVEIFRATSSDDQARLTFDIGADTSAVEIKELKVKRYGTGEDAFRAPVEEFSVSYRFNDHGCRGPDYVIPKPAEVRRILVLGDSYALGVGVHEEDTVAARLQTLLNADANPAAGVRYEVINCAVSGYSTLQERLLFEILAPVYQPDIVLLGMVMNDDSSWRSDVANGYFHEPSRFEGLFLIWHLIQYGLHEGRKPETDFSGSLKEVRLLGELTAAANARLVAFSFRNHPLTFTAWRTLGQTMSAGLAGSDIPWLDVGDRLVDDQTWERLLVYPRGDFHPNEIAHQSAADQLAELLRSHGLVQ